MPLRDILLIAVIVALLPVSLMRPWIGILTWSWIGYMNPHRLVWVVRDWPVAQAVAGVTLLGLLFTRDRRSIPWTREMVILVLIAAHFTITTIFAWYPDVAWPQWEKVAKILLFTFITPMLIFSRQRVRLLMLVIVFSIGFYGFKGGIFSIVTGGQYMVLGPANSFIGANTTIGLAMNMMLPLMLLVAREEANRYLRWLLFSMFWLTIVAIIFTYSRGALLGLFAVLLAIFWRNKGRILLLCLVAALGFSFVQGFIPSKWFARQETTLEYREDNSAMQRIQAWSVAKNIALDRPLLGAGFNFEYASNSERWLSYADFLGDWHNRTRAAHSIYFQVLGQHGFLGLILFLGLLFGSFFKLHKLGKYEYDEEASWIGRYAKAAQLSLIPYMVSGAFLSLAYFDLFYMYVALSAILAREAWEYQERTAVAHDSVIADDRAHIAQSDIFGGPSN